MENDVKSRLIEFIRYAGISIREFERSIGVANGYINGITKGIGADRLLRINRLYPTLSTEWLLTGKGSMLTNIVQQSNINGDNNNATNTSSKLDEMLLAELAEQRKLVQVAQEQVNQLIAIIQKMQG